MQRRLLAFLMRGAAKAGDAVAWPGGASSRSDRAFGKVETPDGATIQIAASSSVKFTAALLRTE